jgi:hypothetical protein
MRLAKAKVLGRIARCSSRCALVSTTLRSVYTEDEEDPPSLLEWG